jgi:pimeloyl-ACP methyl ester carboxylesterase
VTAKSQNSQAQLYRFPIRMPLPIRNLRMRLSQGHLFWREVGQGKALIFLHGAWEDGNQWLPVMELLSQRYHCIAPDLLGFGESERPKLHYSIALEAECLSELLDTLKLRQVYLIGESVGAWIATSYALRLPEQVKGLVLLSPEGIPDARTDRWRWQRWLTRQPPILYWLLRSLLPLSRLFKQAAGIEKLLQLRRQLCRSPIACKLLFRRRQSEIQAELLHPERLQWLKLPILLLQDHAEVNPAFPAFVNQAPQARLHQLPEIGWGMSTTLAAEVALQIDEFVQQHR